MWLIIVASSGRASSRTVTRPSCRQCNNPTWSHTAYLSRFHTCCRSPFRLHNHRIGCWGGALWRACNLTSFSSCLTGPVDYLFASCHKGPRFKSTGGYLCETGILLLALSRYSKIYILKHPSLFKKSKTDSVSKSKKHEKNFKRQPFKSNRNDMVWRMTRDHRWILLFNLSY
jgi:hypothetical protein